jgi:LysM repeat protein
MQEKQPLLEWRKWNLNQKQILAIVIIVVLVVILVLAVGYYFGTHIAPAETEYYLVKAGNTCRGISFEHNISMESLIQQNNLAADCSNLVIG